MKIVKDTPFEFGFIPWQVRPPAWSLVLVVKGTYTGVDNGVCTDAPAQRPVHGEIHWDDDPAASLRFDTDFAVFKPRAECYLAGNAQAPRGVPTPAVEVSFRVGPVLKSLRVTGDRATPESSPAPFTAMPLRWERAFGGSSHRANPVGVGLDVVDTPEGRRRPVPNLENPHGTSDRSDPWGAFPLAMHWSPRDGLVGTYDDRWLRTRWPWLPDDLNWRFYNSAPADQQIDGYWRGDEEVGWQHLHPERTRIRSRLPGETARCFALLRRGDVEEFREVVLRLDTIVIDGDEDAVLCSWRGALEVADQKASDVDTLFFVREPLDARRSLADCRAWLDRKLAEAEAEDRDLEAEPVPAEPDAAEAFELPAPPDGVTNEGLQLLAGLRARAEQLRPAQPDEATMLDAIHDVTRDELTGVTPEPPEVTLPEIKARAKAAEVELPAEVAALPDHVAPEPPPEEIVALDAEAESETAPPTRESLLYRRAHVEPFTDMELADVDLHGVDFSGVDFKGSVLSRASFRGAILDGCVFEGCVLDGADLTGASLREAKMKGADLTGASREGANLEGAVLDEVIAGGARCAGARFRGAHLEGAELTDGEFSRCDFEGAMLDGADLSHAVCEEARFVRASMKETWFEAVRAKGAVFDDADLTGLRAAEGSDFTDASLQRVRAADSKWDHAALLRANMQQSVFERADFAGAGMVQANLTRSNLRNAKFQEAVAVAAVFVRADMFEGDFEGADLSHADFRGANLFGAQLWRANLSGASTELAETGRTRLERGGA